MRFWPSPEDSETVSDVALAVGPVSADRNEESSDAVSASAPSREPPVSAAVTLIAAVLPLVGDAVVRESERVGAVLSSVMLWSRSATALRFESRTHARTVLLPSVLLNTSVTGSANACQVRVGLAQLSAP